MPSFFSKYTDLFSRARVWQRSTIVLALVWVLGLLALVLVVIDTYAFYLSHIRQAPVPVPAAKNNALTERDIDAAIQVLDARQERMRNLLQGVSPGSVSGGGTAPVQASTSAPGL